MLSTIHLSISGTPLGMKTSACAVAVLRAPVCRTGRRNLFRSGLERTKSAVRLGFAVAVLRRPLCRPSATLSPLGGERGAWNLVHGPDACATPKTALRHRPPAMPEA